MHKHKSAIYFFFLFLLLAFRAIFWEGITSKALYDFDEARYAEVAKNHLQTNHWLNPISGYPDNYQDIIIHTLDNGNPLHPDFWKPPLHTWTIALVYKLFGMSELTTRLPSFMFSLLSIYLVFLITSILFSKSILAPYISAILLTLSSDFSFLSSQGIAEMELLFFGLATIYFALKGNYKLSGLFFGLGLLTKSFALFWLPFLILYIIKIVGKSKFTNFITWCLVALLVSLPWHILMYLKFKNIFIQNYFLANLVGRGIGQAGNIAPIYWYIRYILTYHTALCLLVPLVLIYIYKNFNQKIFILLLWIAIIFVPFSLMSSKVWWYIFPIFVPISILAGLSLEKIFTNTKNLILATGLVVLLISLQTYKQTQTRTNFNQGIKNLALNHPGIASLTIYQMPYEAPLFYFNTGKINVDLSVDTNYLLVNQDHVEEIDKTTWKVIDSSLGVFLLKHI